jgi:hypothetical protein
MFVLPAHENAQSMIIERTTCPSPGLALARVRNNKGKRCAANFSVNNAGAETVSPGKSHCREAGSRGDKLSKQLGVTQTGFKQP